MSEDDKKAFSFGNKKFGGSYKPGELELKFPDELSHEEFEEMFKERLQSLHKFGHDLSHDIIPLAEEEIQEKKEKLNPLSIRVKSHTKEFFKTNSLLSARDVLELYENYNHGSEAFINSLLRDEKKLENELAEIQEKLHNARLFKDKLKAMQVEKKDKTDEEILSTLEHEFADSQIKVIFEESGDKILKDIQLYNTQKIVLRDNFLEIVAVNDIVPVVYFFSRELAEDDLIKTLSDIKSFANSNEIEFIEDGE